MYMWLLHLLVCVSSARLCVVVSSAGLYVIVFSILRAFVQPALYLCWLCICAFARKTVHLSVFVYLFICFPLGCVLLSLLSCIHLYCLRCVFGCVCMAGP